MARSRLRASEAPASCSPDRRLMSALRWVAVLPAAVLAGWLARLLLFWGWGSGLS